MAEISEQAKNMVAQFQMYQQQLQTILFQKESLSFQVMEIEKAFEELNSTKQTTAYKITGSIMVNKPVDDLKNELNEKKEDIDVKIKSLEKSEKKINDGLKGLQTKLKEQMK